MRKLVYPLFLVSCLLVLAVTFTACTEQDRAKVLGGTMEVDLPAGQKLVDVEWNDQGNLWFLYRDARPGEQSETYRFKEDSRWGALEGTIIIKEHVN